MKSHYFKQLPLAAALLATSLTVSAQAPIPEILRPDPIDGALLYGLSDNGNWGVSCVSPDAEGFSDFAGASIYNLRTNPVESTNLRMGATFCAAFDVSDDGLTVVGSYQQKPAVCRNQNGKWTWYDLPMPDREISIRNIYTDEYMVYKINCGEVYNVTPDGKLAVGMVSCKEYINIEVGCMWDLEKMEMITLPGLGLETSTFSRLSQISADGRYVVGRKGGYFVYDRDTRTSKSVRVGQDIYAQGMSTNGKWFGGVTQRGDIPYASFWDVENNQLTVLSDELYSDAVAWTITNEGVPLIARPYITPYADAYVYYDDFLYSFEEILTQGYGMDLSNYGIDNTGKPFKVSADGRTIVFITAIGDSYVLRLKEDIEDAVARVDLFRNWSVSPTDGTRMASVGEVILTFPHQIELAEGGPTSATLLDAEGNIVATTVNYGGLSIFGNTGLYLKFPRYAMAPGQKYTVVVPEGMVSLKGQRKQLNPELRVEYEGRENEPVKPASITPAPGSAMASLSLADNPVAIQFDTRVKMNIASGGERPVARIYIDRIGDENLIGWANLDVDLFTGNTLVVFPDNTIPFYKGSTYVITVPEGVVTDMSGAGPSGSIEISYEGALVPQLGDDKYLFRSGCDDYTNFLFYEGDHGNPTSEYVAMGFTKDETPWSVVREDDYSTDMAFGSHSSYNPLVKADDWVATRQILLPADTRAYLTFDSQSHRKARTDSLKVIIYENASLINSLNAKIVDDIRVNGHLVYNEIQSPGATEANLAGEWTHNLIDLSPYAGKAIYICFLNDNYNGSMVMIDNIEVVNDVNAFITLRNATNVVAQNDIKIWGMVTVNSEAASYTTLEMELKDAGGNTVSTIKESGMNLKAGDFYTFEFPQNLQLTAGIENPFTIVYTLGDDRMTFEGQIRNLIFEPEKRVVIEEFTGRGCQFCPGGLVTMEHLESLYGDKVLPIALHCYMGTDPKGRNVMDYWEYTGMGAAPQARVNRGPASSPILQTPNGYVNSGVNGEKLWKDYVAEELNEPALVDVSVTEGEHSSTQFVYNAYFRSALTLEDCSFRVFGVLLEDELPDLQSNAYYSTTDPLLGEWGSGGKYGTATAYTTFFNVARDVWGTSFNGTPGLLPRRWEAGETVMVEMTMSIPDVVERPEKCKFIAMVIDESTGRVVNASRSDVISTGIEATEDGSDTRIEAADGLLTISSDGRVSAAVYDVAGNLLASGEGAGALTIDMRAYRGIAIVKAVSRKGTKTAKILF